MGVTEYRRDKQGKRDEDDDMDDETDVDCEMMKRGDRDGERAGIRSKSLLNHTHSTPVYHSTLHASTLTKQSITYVNCFSHLERV
jgi:hypothetical protein